MRTLDATQITSVLNRDEVHKIIISYLFLKFVRYNKPMIPYGYAIYKSEILTFIMNMFNDVWMAT